MAITFCRILGRREFTFKQMEEIKPHGDLQYD